VDDEIAAKLAEAEAIVLDYIGDRDNSNGWGEIPDSSSSSDAEPVAVPGVISSAVLLALSALWEGRQGDVDQAEPLSPAVKNLLRRYRDPPLA